MSKAKKNFLREVQEAGLKNGNNPLDHEIQDAELLAEMIGAMLLDPDLINLMYEHFFNLCKRKPHKDFSAIIKTAKENGTFPQVECKVREVAAIDNQTDDASEIEQ